MKEIKESTGADGVLRHGDLTYSIIGCAQRVHRLLGPGFPEAVYHKALSIELSEAGLPFESEKVWDVFYKGDNVGRFRCDLVIDSKVVLEIKALAGLTDEHLAQALSYLKASGLDLALLVNFGSKSLEIKRLVV